MKVRDIMSHGVQTAQPEDTVRDVAQSMADLDIGSMPVVEGQKLIGMITDRDIALRVVGAGLSSATLVHQAMTRDVEFCQVDDDIDEVAQKMGKLQVRRLPVLDDRGPGARRPGDGRRGQAVWRDARRHLGTRAALKDDAFRRLQFRTNVLNWHERGGVVDRYR
jgi:CBS domain-containing protein